MNLRVLSIAFLLLVSFSAICHLAVSALKAPMSYAQDEHLAGSYRILDGDGEVDPEGDPKDPGPWPTKE